MTPERWRQLDQLFNSALAREPEERAAFLAQACGGDDELRREVAALLAAAEQTTDALPAQFVAAMLADEQGREIIGRQLGHYRILSLLGQGGMGEVYLAADTQLGRKVAVKLLPAQFTQERERVRRFEREARAASAINHPNILTIYEIGRSESLHFIAAEYVEGQTLRRRMQRARLPLPAVLDVAGQIASALNAAHTAGIIHRDIKPENVMLRPDGLVKVLDFGLAKLNEAPAPPVDPVASTLEKQSTAPGLVLGTVSYMSPEQARGQKVDHRTDIFSLGVLLYEMFTGQRPFAGATVSDVLAALLTTEPPPWRQHCNGATPELERIVGRCLAKEREARYQTAQELIAELKLSVADNDAAVPSGKTRARTGKDAAGSRERALALFSRSRIVLACVLLLLGGALGWRWFKNAANETRRAVPTPQIRRFTVSGNVVLAALSPDGKYVATALEDGGSQSLLLRQTAAHASGLRLVAPAQVEYLGLTFSHDSNFLYCLSWVRNQSDPELNQLPVLGGTPRRLPLKRLDTPVSLAPTGDRFAYVTSSPPRRESYVMVTPVDSESPEILAKRAEPNYIPSYPGGPAWSPDGQFIAYAATSPTADARRPLHVFVANAANKAERQLSQQSWAEAGRVAWLSDGSGLVVSAREDGAGPRQLWLVAWPAGSARKITNDLHDYDGVSLSADGQTLAAVQAQTSFMIAVDTTANLSQPIEIYAEVNQGNERLAWTPDQRLLYNSRVSGNWDIWVMNKDGSGQQQLTVDPHNDTMPAVSADGRSVYFASDRAGSANIWRMKIDGSGATRLTNGADQFFPEITPDNQWLFFQHGSPPNARTVWRMPPSGGEPLRVSERTMQERQAGRPAVSPDGQWLAYVSLDTDGWGVMVRELNSGKVAKRFNFPSNIGARDVRWTPDGQGLAYIVQEKGISNLWVQPLNGAPPRPLTHFKTGRFSVFAWSPDGQWLAYQRQTATSDVVLLRNFR